MVLALSKLPQYLISDDDTMLTTQDIAVINDNMPNKFDVIINQENSKNWTVDFFVNNSIQQLITWTGHQKTFKTFETVLTCLEKYCFNARKITIRIKSLKQEMTLVQNSDKPQL